MHFEFQFVWKRYICTQFFRTSMLMFLYKKKKKKSKCSYNMLAGPPSCCSTIASPRLQL